MALWQKINSLRFCIFLAVSCLFVCRLRKAKNNAAIISKCFKATVNFRSWVVIRFFDVLDLKEKVPLDVLRVVEMVVLIIVVTKKRIFCSILAVVFTVQPCQIVFHSLKFFYVDSKIHLAHCHG